MLGIFRCTNCGALTRKSGVLPLCGHCLESLGDYEQLCRRLVKEVEISVEPKCTKISLAEFMKV